MISKHEGRKGLYLNKAGSTHFTKNTSYRNVSGLWNN